MDAWDFVIIIVAAAIAIGWVIDQVGDAYAKANKHKRPSIEHLDVVAGDTVIVTPGAWLPHSHVQHMKDWLRNALPKGVNVIVADPGTTVQVISPEDAS